MTTRLIAENKMPPQAEGGLGAETSSSDGKSYTILCYIIYGLIAIACVAIDPLLTKFGWEQVLHHLQRTYDRANPASSSLGYREVQVR